MKHEQLHSSRLWRQEICWEVPTFLHYPIYRQIKLFSPKYSHIYGKYQGDDISKDCNDKFITVLMRDSMSQALPNIS
jgi:hypothetical protein